MPARRHFSDTERLPMTHPTSRRNFLRGRFSPAKGLQRPPWAIAERDFLEVCTRCGDCCRACPTQILVEREGGYPGVDFGAGECTFCGDCVTACRSSALVREAVQAPWSIIARFGENCLARQRVECRVCGEQCENGAIRFPPQAGGVAVPSLDPAQCSGCGACVAPCPTQAIVIVEPG